MQMPQENTTPAPACLSRTTLSPFLDQPPLAPQPHDEDGYKFAMQAGLGNLAWSAALLVAIALVHHPHCKEAPHA